MNQVIIMGIQGLLPFLSKSTRDAHISEFENMFVAIDAYCWLHKGIYSCAAELAMKKQTIKYITYCMRYVEMLRHFNVKPIFVFDGRMLFSKKETEKKRREERKKKFERGKELMRAGKTQEGRKLLGESVDVTHEMAVNLIRECRKRDVDCIIAPFEADAQLAFLSIRNIVQCVITEDSDLLAYGCERVMFKMDTTGRGKLTEKREIHVSLGMAPEEFNEDLFRYMCILSGCDYLPSLTSIGPANALKFVKLLKDKDIYETLPKLPIYLNKMNVKVSPEYIVGFKVADNTFKHQLVYDPFLRTQVPLRPVNNDDEIVGAKLPDDLAFQLAIGNIDPITMKKVDDFDPDTYGRGFSILWKTDLLPNATPREISFTSNRTINETKKRQREGVDSDTVSCFTNDLKKQRLPLSASNYKVSAADKPAQRVPRTGFIFEPIVADEKKNITKSVEESKLLKSRYFSRSIGKNQRDQKQGTTANDRRKDESYEEYLRRLYDEYFPQGGEEGKEEDECSCNEEAEKENCASCEKCRKCCGCVNDTVTHSQKLEEYIRELEEHKKLKQNPSAHRFLLDEICRNQEDETKTEKCEMFSQEEEPEKELDNESPGLSIDFSKILSSVNEADEDAEIKTVEKENIETVCNDERDSPVRSPSPVFRFRKGGKILNRNSKCETVSDTAATPTSVYFTSSALGSSAISSSPVSRRSTPHTSSRKTPFSATFGGGHSKKNLKGTTASRTLFQFGFKKERKNDDERS